MTGKPKSDTYQSSLDPCGNGCLPIKLCPQLQQGAYDHLRQLAACMKRDLREAGWVEKGGDSTKALPRSFFVGQCVAETAIALNGRKSHCLPPQLDWTTRNEPLTD